MDPKNRFPIVRKILPAVGLSAEAIEEVVERILDWLSAKDEPTTGASVYPFHLRDDFLSPAEASFFRVLRSVTGQQVVAIAKVNLTGLFFAQTGGGRLNRAASNRIDRKNVDFLLCDSMTLRPCWTSNWTTVAATDRSAKHAMIWWMGCSARSACRCCACQCDRILAGGVGGVDSTLLWSHSSTGSRHRPGCTITCGYAGSTDVS